MSHWFEYYTLEGVAERIGSSVRSWSSTVRTTASCRWSTRSACTRPSARGVKRIRIFTAEEGGSEDCQEDNRQIGASFIADWIADHI